MKPVGTIGLLPVLTMLAGCFSVGPDYSAPEIKTSQGLSGFGVPSMTDATNAVNSRVELSADELSAWWKSFKDETLTTLIDRAFEGNLSLRSAAQRVRESRALLAVARGKWEPMADADAAYTRAQTSANGTSGRRMTRNIFTGGFDASWEIDIFGGVRRNVEAAEADLAAEEAGLDNAWVSLAAEVGMNYINLRTTQQRLRVARSNLRLQQETYDILNSRAKAGIGDDLAVKQALYNVETTRATIPDLLAKEEAYLNSLAVLTGCEPGTLHRELADGKLSEPLLPRSLTGIDAELLRRRPDIRKAERELAAQSARIGIAKSELYPRFFLSGSIGLESLKSTDFFKKNAVAWDFGPSVSWKLFSGNSVRANIDVQDARYEAALADYEETLLSAQAEIRDALFSYIQEFNRYSALKRGVAAASDAVNIANDLYRNGLRDFNNVLDAQRSLLALEEAYTQSHGNIAVQLINLYRSLGGGWSSWAKN